MCEESVEDEEGRAGAEERQAMAHCMAGPGIKPDSKVEFADTSRSRSGSCAKLSNQDALLHGTCRCLCRTVATNGVLARLGSSSNCAVIESELRRVQALNKLATDLQTAESSNLGNIMGQVRET